MHHYQTMYSTGQQFVDPRGFGATTTDGFDMSAARMRKQFRTSRRSLAVCDFESRSIVKLNQKIK